jgi:superfamily II DNA or RNA helicase
MYANDLQDDGDSDSDNVRYLDSDLTGPKRRKAKISLRGPRKPDDKFKHNRQGERQSGRATRHQGGMQEIDETAIYRSDSDDGTRAPPKPKAIGAREQFKTLPRNDEFRMRHIQDCETCGQGVNYAPLVYCQGCTLAYHKSCLGPRNSREHLVTKIGGGDSVLQCRRCVGYARKKDPTAPDQGKCADCHQHGNACHPFRSRKSSAQEQKERDENEGEDPSYEVDPSRLNQADNVLFRCLSCWRAFHFEHLPSRSDIMDMDAEVDAEQRFREYSRDWRCKDCLDMPAKVSGLIAWKPIDEDSYDPGMPLEAIDEDEKAYLVKWEAMSYFRACWMPGAWVWGVSAHGTRKAFAKRDDAQHPKMRTEDAIPEDFLRTDIVLDIKYTSYVEHTTAEVDKARIREIDKALIKYKGLGYEDAVWEAPPQPDDGERWNDFLMAYNDWILGRYIRPAKTSTLKSRIEKARNQDFAKLEKKTQPDNVEGGQLMQYQIEGLNWLYYKWFTQKNAILADEMGLGKTMQIIGFLATLVADWSCFPFLVVVPNSTCPNWRREIKRWAPSLRVVAYYGSRESRDLAYKYELFPNGSKEVRCHVVVTSYDAAADDTCRKFFKSVPWQGLVVDEGQRLKNDKGLLYSALSLLKVPFKILLTGTPLQNNQRELFNLLQFLDDSKNAAELEEEFADLDSNKIIQLHDMIRPFFLRRTKAQVLTFLPPMAQIIVPVSMTFVQKKLYRTILAKNPDLMKAIFSTDATLKGNERAGLNNILMQLRKCLCHPFVYNNSIEERNVSHATSHRNLVDASSKLKLLEQLLPKLRERGHRVLIFSQFLDMLDIVEDFCDGMELKYQRLDGSISALQKQKRIDEFNAPDSALFAFLLSTRAGGVGINLATADTVIILDPDFNPHQDIQALSRAHRIGQHKKVLCFQLVTRASAEERIMQMGRKKLALDHVLIQEMDADDADQNDLVSVLRHGASEIFEDSGDQDILYDSASVDRLLDRSHMEDTKSGEDKSAETQFSFARVWANDQGTLQDEMVDGVEEEQKAPNPGLWANILKERERIAAEESAAKAYAYGRGRRARGNVDYNAEGGVEGVEGIDISPAKPKKNKSGDESDTDFQADGSEPDDDDAEAEGEDGEVGSEVEEAVANREIERKKNGKPITSHPSNSKKPMLPTPLATPKKASAPTSPSKPKASSKNVKKLNGSAGNIIVKPLVKNGKVRTTPKASASIVKASGSGRKPKSEERKRAKAAAGQASASSMKQPTEPPATPRHPNGHSQPFNNAGSPADPIVLESDEETTPASPIIAPERRTHHAHPPFN